MTHLGERITDFVFGELPPVEMEAARVHLAACVDCRTQVEQFETTRSLLKLSADEEPPRRIVFEVEKQYAPNFWRWLIPAGLAAAALLAVLIAVPPSIQWSDSGLTIAFGSVPTPATVAAPQSVPVVLASEATPDYEMILKKLEQAFDQRDASRLKKIQRLQDELTYVEAQRRSFERDASQLIAESGTQD